MHFAYANLSDCRHKSWNKFFKKFFKIKFTLLKNVFINESKILYFGILNYAPVFNQLWLFPKEKSQFTLYVILKASEFLRLAWVEESSQYKLFHFGD